MLRSEGDPSPAARPVGSAALHRAGPGTAASDILAKIEAFASIAKYVS